MSRYQRLIASTAILVISEYWDTQDITLVQDIMMSGYYDTVISKYWDNQGTTIIHAIGMPAIRRYYWDKQDIKLL